MSATFAMPEHVVSPFVDCFRRLWPYRTALASFLTPREVSICIALCVPWAADQKEVGITRDQIRRWCHPRKDHGQLGDMLEGAMERGFRPLLVADDIRLYDRINSPLKFFSDVAQAPICMGLMIIYFNRRHEPFLAHVDPESMRISRSSLCLQRLHRSRNEDSVTAVTCVLKDFADPAMGELSILSGGRFPNDMTVYKDFSQICTPLRSPRGKCQGYSSKTGVISLSADVPTVFPFVLLEQEPESQWAMELLRLTNGFFLKVAADDC